MEHQLEEVISWLEAGDAADYQTGVLLLQKHSRNRGLVGLLLKKESAANRDKLCYELVKAGCQGRMDDVSEVLNHFAQAVQGAVPVVQQVADVLTQQTFPTQPNPEHVPDELRPQVDELTQLMSRVHNQRCQLSNSLADLPAAEGPRVVSEILKLEQQYNALAQKRHNVLAPEQPAAPASQAPIEQLALTGEAAAAPGPDRAALLQQRQNLRSNISKGKGKITSAKTDAKRLEHQEKVSKWEIELQQVDRQLALPQAETR